MCKFEFDSSSVNILYVYLKVGLLVFEPIKGILEKSICPFDAQDSKTLQ